MQADLVHPDCPKQHDLSRAYWDRHAPKYDRSMKILGGPMPRTLQLAAEAVRGAERVLELAAGTGLVTLALAREARWVVATDYSRAMVSLLEKRVRAAGLSNVECRQADIYALDLEPGSFDVVVAANVLHLLPDLEGALLAMRRMLRPGGRLVLPTFCHEETRLARLASRILAITGFPGQRRFCARSLQDALQRVGIEVLRAETIPGLLPIGYVEGRFAR